MGFIKISGKFGGTGPNKTLCINTDQIQMVCEGVIFLLAEQGASEGSGLRITTILTSDAILDLIARAGVGVAR